MYGRFGCEHTSALVCAADCRLIDDESVLDELLWIS